jgi:hypothetical protein
VKAEVMTFYAVIAAAAAAKSKDVLAGRKITALNAEIALSILTSAKSVGFVRAVSRRKITAPNAGLAMILLTPA